MSGRCFMFVYHHLLIWVLDGYEFRSSHRRFHIKKCIPKNFAKFIGKHLCQSLAIKAWGLQLYLKRDSSTGVFLWFEEMLKNVFITEHLCAATFVNGNNPNTCCCEISAVHWSKWTSTSFCFSFEILMIFTLQDLQCTISNLSPE